MKEHKTESLSFGHTTTIPDLSTEIPMHSHAAYELYYFLSGNCDYTVEGVSNHLESGTLLAIRAGETHRPVLRDTSPYERITIHFLPEALDSLDPSHRLLTPFDDHPLGRNNLYSPVITRESGIADCFSSIQQTKGDAYDLHIRVQTMFFRILCILSDLHKEQSATSALADPLVMAIIDYINLHLTAPLSLETICREFFISKSHLQRLFRHSTGTTLWNYITLKRLTFAQKQIRDGISAAQAAADSGFPDYSTFSAPTKTVSVTRQRQNKA